MRTLEGIATIFKITTFVTLFFAGMFGIVTYVVGRKAEKEMIEE